MLDSEKFGCVWVISFCIIILFEKQFGYCGWVLVGVFICWFLFFLCCYPFNYRL